MKRAGVSQKDLMYYYEAVVRPVLEYASPVWHTSLTADQTKTLETVQWRACQIITGGGTYTENCALLRLENPADRRDWQSRKLFKQIANRIGHCLHRLMPAKSEETVTSRLRHSVKLPQLFARKTDSKKIFLFALDFLIISNFSCNFIFLAAFMYMYCDYLFVFIVLLTQLFGCTNPIDDDDELAHHIDFQ